MSSRSDAQQVKVEAAGGLYAVVYGVREAVEVVGRWANG